MNTALLLVRRSLRQYALSSTLTILNIALACGLVISVFSIKAQAERAFTVERMGFDAVLGARGSKLQLVLNAVFHLEVSPGNIPWSLYDSIRADPSVSLAIPYALGDNYYGFRIVGTIPDLFEKLSVDAGGPFDAENGGRFFDPARREAVVGSYAAQRTRLKVGDTINPFHGLSFDPKNQHSEKYVVVGVLKPTNSPADRVIWIPIEGVYRMSGHVLRGDDTEYTPEAGKPIAQEHKEVSAVMLKFASPQAGFALDYRINRQGKIATLAYPVGAVMSELFNRIGWITKVLQLVAYLVLFVAVCSVTASIYNTMNERRRDFAILRSLGARRRFIFSVIVIESTVISAIGSIAALAVYTAILASTRMILRTQTGVLLDPLYFHPSIITAPIGTILLGAACGIIPAIKAYATDVASNLSPIS